MVPNWVQKSLDNATEKDLKVYKQEWLGMPPELTEHPFLGVRNAGKWVNLQQYELFIRNSIGQSVSKPRTSQLKPVKIEPNAELSHRKRAREIIVISDDSEPETILQSNSKPKTYTARQEPQDSHERPAKRHASNPDVEIDIIDSDDDSPDNKTKSEFPSTVGTTAASDGFPKDREGRYIVTRKVKVDSVEHLDGVPHRWPVPEVDTAYVLDFGGDARVSGQDNAVTVTRKPKGLDTFLKSEDQDSWGRGTNGSTSHDVKLTLLGNLPVRRSVHDCNGALQCEMFDTRFLNGYEWIDSGDSSKMTEIFEAEQAQNRADGETVLGITNVFYRLILTLRCKKKCDGSAVLKPLRNPPSVEGKAYFVGCTKWTNAERERWEHIYAPIPASVDESILFQLMNGQPITSPDLLTYGRGCATFLHPRHGKQKHCKHIHFRKGHSVSGRLVHFDCPAKKIVYTSKDPQNPKVVVIFQGRHSHPPWPDEKPSTAAKDDLQRCLNAFGILGATADRLDNASTTLALLGSSLSAKHEAFRNRKLLRGKIQQKKDEKVPAGYQWQGIVDQYEQDQKLSPDERYIWHLRMEGEIKLAVTMNPILAALIHTAQYLVADYTFKRVNGELDECEFVVWYAETNERVTIARLYCNSATRKAFGYAFEALFTSIEKATHQQVKFKVFDNSGHLLAVLLDMEAAQVQGLGDAVVRLRMNNPATSGICETDPDVLVQFFIKLCTVHFERRTDELVGALGKNTVEYLNKFRALSSPEDIAAWHAFCKDHPSEKLRNWYAHKIQYPWLLPGFNKYLSRMPNNFWDRTPHHTNLVETAHAGTNRSTQINLRPLEAIQRARTLDASVAASITAAKRTCIFRNPHNGQIDRMTRSITRQTKDARRRATHQDLNDNIDDLRERITNASQAQKELRAQLKDLTEQKKEAGRTPRHNQSTSKFDDVKIPPIRGLNVVRGLGVVPVTSPGPATLSLHAGEDDHEASFTPDLDWEGIAQTRVNQDRNEGPAQLRLGRQLGTHLLPQPFTVPSNAPPCQQIQHPFSTMNPPPASTSHNPSPPTQQADDFGPLMFLGQDHSLDMDALAPFPGWHPGYGLPMIDLDLLNIELEEMYPTTST